MICRAVTHDGAAALASVCRMAELDAAVVYPGHGDSHRGTLRSAAAEALAYGLH